MDRGNCLIFSDFSWITTRPAQIRFIATLQLRYRTKYTSALLKHAERLFQIVKLIARWRCPRTQPEAVSCVPFKFSVSEAKNTETAQPMSPRWTQGKASSVPSVA